MAKRTKGRITCKRCGVVFANMDAWEDYLDCQNTNCSCPKVQKAMTIANTAIEKARSVPEKTIIVKKEHIMPDGYREDETDSMLYIEVPTVQTFLVTPTPKK